MTCQCGFSGPNNFNITELCDDCWDSINNWFGEEEIEDTISNLSWR